MQIAMLGPFEVRGDDGVLVDVPGARLRGVLVALALDAGQLVPKARLADWVWGEQPPAEAANALQRLASRLRKVIPVEGTPDGYRLVIEPDAVDAVRFERLLGQGRLREALDLWRGSALQDVGLQDSTAFDAAVTRLEGLRLTVAEDWFDAEIARGRGAQLVTELTDLVAAHPVRERLVGALMQALAASGRDSEALLVYQRTRDALVETLGVDPSPELSALHVALLRGESVRRDEPNRETNLRAELTSYIGKAADVAEVRELVATHRLTTLIGPGGAGKTRLSTEAGRTLTDVLPDGVWFVELAPIGTEADVAQTAIATLGLRDGLLGDAQEVDPTERVIAAFRDREALLILDNCEHVIDSAARFAERVLGQCPKLRILATSREPLGITGEALWRVVPLALPTADADAESSPAVQLLRDRASAVRDLGTDAHTLATMARVCRALDGMPLAIELAAARLRTMSLDQLADRLDDVFRLLTGGSRTALPRQRTLRAVIDWSWQLLSDDERMVLRRLSVFAGGASLAAAEQVCGTADALELLTALTEKSLVVADSNKTPRYRMLGMIKEYAAQRLADADEVELTRHAHLTYFTELAATADPHLRRAEQLEWLAVLDADHDNISAAMRGAIAAGEAAAAMRLASVAGWYWWLSGHKAEGNDLIKAAIDTPGEVPDETRAMVYSLFILFLNSGPGDEHLAREWIHEIHRISQRTQLVNPVLQLVEPLERMLQSPGDFLPAWEPLLDSVDPWVRALGQLQLGKMRVILGHGGYEADNYLKAALADFEVIGERFGITFALSELADRIATRGEFAAACAHYDHAIEIIAEISGTDDVVRMRSRQAELYWLLDDPERSAAALAEAQRLAEQVNWPGSLANLALSKATLARWRGDAADVLAQLTTITSLLGEAAEQPNIRTLTHDLLGSIAEDLDEAREHWAAACAAATETGHASGIAGVLVGVAGYALRRERYADAVRLLAASTAVRGLPDRSNPDFARIEQATRSRLGDAEYAEAAAEGAQADWNQLVAVTLAS
ncbi:BTAD domain-containing putative transcriptional regulator [Kribbella albertanoniae]|uniref:AfsR/SARP family transcriptional regulator n=1 Tax=Kribbella albertanoniae TaxID=1266829 RepID=A0A4R4NYV7_9ACTN|nr:BTAD domain-containing putative transcriptional regulator [Kribbella albertanoniae]TDC15108.1 AfsR/SARP family transcriptional regulator [Kribbella albertanoniae]